MTTAATSAIAALQAAEVPHQLVRYRHNPNRGSFGAEAVDKLAALAIDATAEQVFKTLILTTSRGLAVAVLPAPSRLSLKAAATALGVPKATMADPAPAERATGYVLGAISPFGLRKPLPTVVDTSALKWPRVWCSAGKRGWEVAVAPQDLIRLTAALTAAIRTQSPQR